jgi:hypothetical protein
MESITPKNPEGSSRLQVPDEVRFAKRIDLPEGCSRIGVVVRLPESGAVGGNSLYLRDDNGRVIAFSATGKHGHTLLERALGRFGIKVGDRIRVSSHGWKRSRDGERHFRDERVLLIDRASAEASEPAVPADHTEHRRAA